MPAHIKTRSCSGCGHAVVADALHCPRCRRKLTSRWPLVLLAAALATLTATAGWTFIPAAHGSSTFSVSR